MKSRWIVNLVLLVLVVGIVLALKHAPEQKKEVAPAITVSTVDTDNISRISIEAPAKAPVELEKQDGAWFLTKPYKARAGGKPVYQMLAVLRANSVDKFDANDPARFGLDHPALKLKLDDQEITFGTLNPVNGMQYIGYQNSVFLVESKYAEALTIQVVEMLDKNLLKPGEDIAGFDFSHLEQWEEGGGLKMMRENGQWKVERPNAHPVQNDINAWFDDSWKTLIALSVEPYQPNSKAKYPSFDIKLKNGKILHFEKQGESPELKLARPDEGMIYHFPQDVGFQILNPPVGSPK
jgi:hypothetical protein